MIYVLQVVSLMDAGGVENFIMNMYRKIDREQVQFYFLVHHKKRGFFEDEIEALGGQVFHLPVMDDHHVLVYRKQLDALFREHPEITIVHGNMSSLAFLYLRAAKQNCIDVRILHSHNAGHAPNVKGLLKSILAKMGVRQATDRFACSQKAGDYLFGKKSYRVIPNGVDPDAPAYSEDKRKAARQMFHLPCDALVLGHVGRFNVQKNHGYLIDIFRAFAEKHEHSYLLLIGEGDTMEDMKKRVHQYGLDDKVIFGGVHKNMGEIYAAMDVFLLPSLFEGLPLVAIEAQYSGLPCILSDAITVEAHITARTTFLPIGEKDRDKWVQEIEVIDTQQKREPEALNILNDNYNVNRSSQNMERFYCTRG